MTAIPANNLTVDEFIAWASEQPGRYELHAGRVYAMSPERAGHAAMKFVVQTELARAIKVAGIGCYMLPDGMTVRVADDTAHEPDALVYCGDKVAPEAIEIARPVIVVEVLSPSTRHIDASAKLAGYFQVPSIEHYLIVDPSKRPLIHHSRHGDGTILTRLVQSGPLLLKPPGITIDVDSVYS